MADMTYAVQDRHSYLVPVNRWFHRNYANIDEFKNHDEFQRILDEYVTLNSIKQAIRRAEGIVHNNSEDRKFKEIYHGFAFYRDNPDISIHKIIQMIFEVCEVK